MADITFGPEADKAAQKANDDLVKQLRADLANLKAAKAAEEAARKAAGR
jgi:hypothetical protein